MQSVQQNIFLKYICRYINLQYIFMLFIQVYLRSEVAILNISSKSWKISFV